MNKLESTIIEEEVRKSRILKQINSFMTINNIESINELTKDDIEKILLEGEYPLVKESRTTMYNNISALNNVLKENGSNIIISSSDYVDKLKFNEDKYFTRKEIRDICNLFTNPQDKFIVYALWNGIMGKDYEDLVNLKVQDIVYDKEGNPQYLKVKNNKVECDEYMQKILKDTLQEDYYETYNNTSSGILGFEFNMDSPYIIKVKPTKLTNDGLNPMNKSGVQAKLKRLNESFNETDIRGIHLTGKTLERSGIMFDMFLKEVYEDVVWTAEKVKEWFKIEGLKGDLSEIHRIYHKKYNTK